MTDQPKTRNLSLYLFRTEVASPADAFVKDLKVPVLKDGAWGEQQRPFRLVVQNNPVALASWASDVAEAFGLDGLEARSTSASAAAAFEVHDPHESANRIMAAAWGPAGRHFLDFDLLDDRFGMTTAMNLIDTNAVRSKDSRSYDDSVKQRRTQSSRLTSFDEFEFDPMREILDHVTGRVLNEYQAFATRISGRHYLQIHGPMAPGDIFTKAEASLAHFHRAEYLEKFSWVKNKRSVTNPKEIARLDEVVVQQLQDGAATNFHLAAPTIVDWDNIEGFVHKGLGLASATPDLDIADYLARAKTELLTPEALRTDSIRVTFLDGRPVEKWPVYRSLVAEVNDAGKKYILSAGRWFSLDIDWVNDIEERVAGIAPHPDLPAASAYDQTEGAYNKATAEALGAVLMDKVPLRPSNASSNIELCDILTEQLEFIHIKKRASSATLSHLYAQGSVSAQAITGDATFRNQARSAIEGVSPSFGGLAQWDTLAPSKLKVVYAVMAEARFLGKEHLPFFSKVSLWQAADLLTRLGYGVAYANILRPTKPQDN